VYSEMSGQIVLVGTVGVVFGACWQQFEMAVMI
jgi:hypothetical protein